LKEGVKKRTPPPAKQERWKKVNSSPWVEGGGEKSELLPLRSRRGGKK